MVKEREKEIKKVGISLVLSWVFSFLAIIAGVADMFYSFVGGLLIILAGIIISPAFNRFVKEKFKIELNGWLKFLIFFILLIIGGNLVATSMAYKTIIENQACTPNWQCDEWSAACIYGIQARTCFDSNNCQSSSGKPEELKACTPNIGDKIIIEDVEYMVNEAFTFPVVGSSYLSKEANGIFIILSIIVKNNKKNEILLSTNDFKIKDSQDRTYNIDTESIVYLKTMGYETFLMERLGAGLTKEFYIIFDVPLDDKGLILRISGEGIFADPKEVKIGDVSNLG